jgi:Rad3-related DNA helicase
MHKYIKTVSFAPISASRFLGKVLDKGKQFVLSSATPPNTEDLRSYLEENRKKITTIEVPSTFPREHRPILMDYAGKMGMKYRDKTIPKMAKKIEVLSADRPTIVHCHSYKIATAIAENISPGKDYILQSDREQDLERFRREGGIFLSVNMNDGVSLDGDTCRINILAKIPFPNLKDAQVEARRKYEGDGWMNRQVARQITQAYGRTTRSKDDWSRFYILDSDFSWFYQRNKGYFPKWFREAIRIKVKPQTA